MYICKYVYIYINTYIHIKKLCIYVHRYIYANDSIYTFTGSVSRKHMYEGKEKGVQFASVSNGGMGTTTTCEMQLCGASTSIIP